MKIGPLPENEKERLNAIRRYHILDTEEEQDFDSIVELATQLCNTPIAFINLIDEHRQWFKAKIGINIRETHRDSAFCAHTILQDDIMMVADTSKDDRFFDNPLVTSDPYIQFYAGMPLITSKGYKLGTLAVLDRTPRSLSEHQLRDLRILAKQVVNLLELRYSILQLQETNKAIACLVEEKTAEIIDVFERVSDAFLAVDRNWCVTYINEKAAQITNRLPKNIIGKNLWAEFPEAFPSDFPKLAQIAIATQQPQYQEAYFPPYGRWIESHIYPSPNGLSIYFRDITERKKADDAIRRSEETKRLIVNSALDAIIWMDTTGVITFWNAQSEKIFGWKEEEILGQHLSDVIIPEQYRMQHENGMKHYLKTGEGAVLRKLIEITALNKEGHEFPVELTIISIKQNESEFFCSFIRDITERKKAEESLRKAEERYRNIFENATEGIYQTTLEGKFITVNPSLSKMFGFESPDELISTITDLGSQLYADPQDRLRMRELLETHGQATGMELKLLKKNKEIMWVRANNRVVKGGEGKIEYFEGMLEDITTRKEAEEKLRLQQQLSDIIRRAQTLFINSEDSKHPFDVLLNDLLCITKSEYGFIGEVLTDTKGQPYLKTHTITNIAWSEETKIYYNENIQEGLIFSNLKTLFGAVMVTGKPVISNSPSTDSRRGGLPQGHPPLNALLGLPFGSNGKIEGMLGLSNREGGYSEDLIKFLEPLVGTITHLVKAAQNEKLRKQSEIALRNSENTLQAFFRSTPDASVLLGKNFEVLASNSSANELVKNIYGRSISQGEFYTDLIFPEVRPLITKFLKNALLGETSQSEFAVPNMKTGKKIWWRVVYMPAYDKDEIIFGVVSNATNIDEIKRAEFKVKNQFEELQKTNHELDRFVYSVSHDLRAPLASILGLINIAEMESPSATQKGYLEMIRGSVNRLDGFIKDILDYSRNSRIEVNVHKINFPELIERVQNNLKSIKEYERLKVILEIHDKVSFYSDQVRIEIILNNLFSNSIKYQDFQKESSYISIHIRTSAGKAWIRFSDNGIGIEKKHMDKIFAMFYRASEIAKGSGLGLYIAKETISKLNGTIKVESEFELSTAFEIEIPNSTAN